MASVCVLSLVMVRSAVRWTAANRAAKRETQIRSIISIGMPETEVRSLLQSAGFAVGPTMKPTVSEYYTMHVPIRDGHISPEATIGYVVTGGKTVFSEKHWVVIELGPDHRVRSID